MLTFFDNKMKVEKRFEVFMQYECCFCYIRWIKFYFFKKHFTFVNNYIERYLIKEPVRRKTFHLILISNLFRRIFHIRKYSTALLLNQYLSHIPQLLTKVFISSNNCAHCNTTHISIAAKFKYNLPIISINIYLIRNQWSGLCYKLSHLHISKPKISLTQKKKLRKREYCPSLFQMWP